MSKKRQPRGGGRGGRLGSVRFAEVEVARPGGMVVVFEDGLRLEVADERGVALAARLINLFRGEAGAW